MAPDEDGHPAPEAYLDGGGARDPLDGGSRFGGSPEDSGLLAPDASSADPGDPDPRDPDPGEPDAGTDAPDAGAGAEADDAGSGSPYDAGGDSADAGTVDAGEIRSPGDELVLPADPGPADLAFSVDATRNQQPISPYIYGTNSPDWSGSARHLAFARAGGNRWTAYNWENNASNAGTDWQNQNDGYLGSSNVAGDTPRRLMSQAHAAGAAFLLQIPMLGYVAADKSPGGDVGQSPDFLQTRFHRTFPSKNGPLQYPPDTSDKAVYQDELVAWLESLRRDPGAPPLFYQLDNEPGLWAETFGRIHPAKATYEEVLSRSVALATAIKRQAPAALVFGPESYGWQGMVDLQAAPDAGGRDFLEHYLVQMRRAGDEAGQRLLDVLSVHWYPEARGGGVRITGDDTSAAVVEARVQAPRSLWDPSYVENSWIASALGKAPIRLIPRLKEKIAARFPGTRLAITEYAFGAGGHISGAVAQADALGVFGREGVFAAALWHLGSDQRFAYGALAMYRNYDGQGGAFGDVSAQAHSSDLGRASVYASVDSSQPCRMVLVAVNKASVTQTAALRITALCAYTRAQVFRLTAASPTPKREPDLALTHRNALVVTLPAMSVSTLMLTAERR